MLRRSLFSFFGVFVCELFATLPAFSATKAVVHKNEELSPVTREMSVSEKDDAYLHFVGSLKCAEDIPNAFWNFTAKYPDLKVEDAALKLRAQFVEKEDKANIIASENYRSPFEKYQKSILNLDKVVADLSVEIATLTGNYDAFLMSAKRDIHGYQSYASQMGQLYSKIYDAQSRLNTWIAMQAKTYEEVAFDVAHADEHDKFSVAFGEKALRDLKPPYELTYEFALTSHFKRPEDADLSWVRNQGADFENKLRDFYDKQVPLLRRKLVDLAGLYGVASRKAFSSPLLLASKIPYPRHELRSAYDIDEYSRSLSGYLKSKGLLKSCQPTLELSKEASELRKNRYQGVPLDPWNRQSVSNDRDIGKMLFDKNSLANEADFETHLKNISSQVLRSTLSTDEIKNQLHRAAADYNKIDRPVAQTKYLNKLQDQVVHVTTAEKQLRSLYAAYSVHQNPETEEKMKAVLSQIEVQMGIIPRRAASLRRAFDTFYPDETANPLAGVGGVLATSQNIFDHHPFSDIGKPPQKEKTFALLSHMQDYLHSLESEIQSVQDKQKIPSKKQIDVADLAPLENWIEALKDLRAQKTWAPLYGKNLDVIVHELAEKQKTAFQGIFSHNGSPSLETYSEFDQDVKAKKVADTKAKFSQIIKTAIEKDPSCYQVVTGSQGDTSQAAIIKTETRKIKIAGEDRKINVDPEYPYFAADSYLQLLCVDWQPKALRAVSAWEGYLEKDLKKGIYARPPAIPAWKRVHPYLRPSVGQEGGARSSDSLVLKENREYPKHAVVGSYTGSSDKDWDYYSKSGPQNLIPAAAFVYSVIQKENRGNNFVTAAERRKQEDENVAEYNRERGLSHASAVCLQDRPDFGTYTESASHPFAMQLLSDYVKKIRSLLNQRTPESLRRLDSFCGISRFSQEFADENPVDVLDKVVRYKSDGKTCDEDIDSGARGYKSGNIGVCFSRIITYCPSYAFAQTMINARGLRSHHGTMFQDQGVKPACQTLFLSLSKAVDDEKNRGERGLCSLSETVE